MKRFRLTVEEVKELLNLEKPVFFIDARTLPDWEKTDTKVKGALRILASEVQRHLGEIPRDRTIITY